MKFVRFMTENGSLYLKAEHISAIEEDTMSNVVPNGSTITLSNGDKHNVVEPVAKVIELLTIL